MALDHSVLGRAPPWSSGGGGGIEDRRQKVLAPVTGIALLPGRVVNLFEGPSRFGYKKRREVLVRARLQTVEVPAAESGPVGKSVEIPVTCYQLLGISEQAEKDEVVKAAMQLKNLAIEEGYTADVASSRKNLLMDVRDKLLFEPECAGNVKEKVPPKRSLHIPLGWLPGALCLLQEAGEEKLVLDMGRTALQHPHVKPYVHDLLLCMALSECSIAKSALEKSKISEGFEALARAQYLLRSKISFEKMPLLSQIEESLEELAPACTIELLSIPQTPENTDRRAGAIAALRELLRQGLEIESSCRVRDWHCFLNQSMNKLMATEIVDLLPWDTLAITRKNKKSLESQNQRTIIDFNCFYMAMIAHIALGFSTRQTDLITKANTICECLLASEGADLKFEEAFCSLLLGQGGEAVVAEKLQLLESNGCSALRNSESTVLPKGKKEKVSVKQSLEMWLKDAVLDVFPDTRDCSPSLANFFGSPKRVNGGKQRIYTTRPIARTDQKLSSSVFVSTQDIAVEPAFNTARHLGEAVKQLAPTSLQTQPVLGNVACDKTTVPFHLKRKPEHQRWKNLSVISDLAGRCARVALTGCILIGAYKLFSTRIGHPRVDYKLNSAQRLNTDSPSSQNVSIKRDRSSFRNKEDLLRKLLGYFKGQLKHSPVSETVQNAWAGDNLSSLPMSSSSNHALRTSYMPVEEAEALVKRWQDIKAEALGPNHQFQMLPEILAETMLSEWRELARAAKANSCFWKFVLLELSVQRADVYSEVDGEVAEIEVVLQEAAELVDGSNLKKPNYYSSYKVDYILKKQEDGSWRFCTSNIQTLE